MSHDPQPLGGKIISKPVMIFGPLIVICMLLIVKRLVFGLGSVSDLNGGFPWGVWIAFDLLIGTGFACGGLAFALTGGIFKKNFFVVLPFFFILYATAFYAGFTLMANPQSSPSLVRVIVSTFNAYISSILYCKLVINYQLQMASRYLPQTTGTQE